MNNLNLIRKIAWDFHKSTGLDWDDLFQEAALAYLEAVKTYDKKRGAITTYAWHCMVSRLKNYLKQERDWVFPLRDIEEAVRIPIHYQSFWHKIPEDIQKQVHIILEGVCEMDSYFMENVPPMAREKILKEAQTSAKITIKRLLRHAKYDKNDIRGTIHELEIAVKQF